MFQKQGRSSIDHSSSASFQVLSDLHLEISQLYSSYEIPVCADHLILAGDIGRLIDYEGYRDFLQKQTDQFKPVTLVLGNHEFYEGTLEEGLEKAKRLEQEPCLKGRLILLHQKRYDLPDSQVTILGCTLWSNIPAEVADIVQYKISDFQKNQRLRKMERQKIRIKKRSILVVTHHAPLMRKTSSPQHAHNPWTAAFGTDIIPQISHLIRTWVFGHTHFTTDFKEGGVRVVSNQRGYVLPWSDPKTQDKFDVRKVINV
ncbi:calcineurin-like phosphoesterase [Penicillium malachiteum]|uniref:calcineurin-like phosphoesterase n=1 Tax=Penicillium malachiteum TaxID=1324776 RepID=UPI0025498A19|nr:calcineurin-like phosphoesterase [Penicillium malachiteum]KAJ5715680.1 calcineurin-like phosphoesterase [Penicillium malachiteum]